MKKSGDTMQSNNFIDKWSDKLIVLEGADDTGKTTVAKLLVEYLVKYEIEAKFTFQPGEPEYGPLSSIFRSLG